MLTAPNEEIWEALQQSGQAADMIDMRMGQDHMANLATLSMKHLQEVLLKFRSSLARVQQEPFHPLANEITVGALQTLELLLRAMKRVN